MQVLGMYGYVDKYNFAIAVARAISIMDRSVLVIDATQDQKYRAIIPSIENTDGYLTQYSEIDFAVGFDTYEKLEEYLKEKNIDINLYSYIIIDVENAQMHENFKSLEVNKSYMFIDTNVVSVSKNEELVKKMRQINPEQELTFTKVMYRAYISRAATTYLEDKIANYGVNWSEEVYDVNIEEQDVMADIDAQYSGLIDLRKHTKPYIMFLAEFVSKLLNDENYKNILKEIKRRKN